MDNSVKVAPYGTWESPITSEMLSGQTVILSDAIADPKSGTIYYLEERPAEDGRSCIVACNGNQINDVLPKEYSARSRVHEYGGGSMAMGSDGRVIFTDLRTFGVFALSYSGTGSVKVTPLVEANAKLRFADFDMHPNYARWILAVREDHRDGEDVDKIRNEIVVIDTETKQSRVVIQGADFYAHPKFSPDGKKVSWVQWNHPDMVWTGSMLYAADWTSGEVGEHVHIAGEARKESIGEPKWSPDGTLWFASDRTGFWQLYHLEGGNGNPQYLKLKGMEDADFSRPEWFLGALVNVRSERNFIKLTISSSTFTCLTGNTIVAGYTKKASTRLLIIDKKTATYTEPDFPHLDGVFFDKVKRLSDSKFIMLGRTLISPQALYLLDTKAPALKRVIKSTADPSIPTSLYSLPQHISFPRLYEREKGGQVNAHTIFTPPHNPKYKAPAGTLPPLIVSVHGGPTLHTSQRMDVITQYWSSRGYAVANLNFAGSSGYGRVFRDALNGWFGVVDSSDAISCVDYLAKQGLVDGKRASIRGASGGGYCVLQSIWMYPDVFKGAVSEYGVGSLRDVEVLNY